MPHYVQMNHKTDDGCKNKYTCCGISMMMLVLKLLKGNTKNESSAAVNMTVPIGD